MPLLLALRSRTEPHPRNVAPAGFGFVASETAPVVVSLRAVFRLMHGGVRHGKNAILSISMTIGGGKYYTDDNHALQSIVFGNSATF
jgi:hypothetical protein